MGAVYKYKCVCVCGLRLARKSVFDMQFQCSGCWCNLANNCHNRTTTTSQLRAYYLKGQRTQLAKHRLSGFAPTPPPFGVQIAFNCSLLPRKRLQLHNPSSFPFLLFWFYTRPLHAITRFNRPCPLIPPIPE